MFVVVICFDKYKLLLNCFLRESKNEFLDGSSNTSMCMRESNKILGAKWILTSRCLKRKLPHFKATFIKKGVFVFFSFWELDENCDLSKCQPPKQTLSDTRRYENDCVFHISFAEEGKNNMSLVAKLF